MSDTRDRPRTQEGLRAARLLAPLYRPQLKEMAADLRKSAERLEKLAACEDDYELVRSSTSDAPICLPNGDVLHATWEQPDAMFLTEIAGVTRLNRWHLDQLLTSLVDDDDYGWMGKFHVKENG